MSEECVFCEGKESLTVLMREALAAKHCESVIEGDRLIDALLRQNEAPDRMEQEALAQFRECNVEVADEEFMKRVYLGEEHDAKIKMLSEYYKFHNDVPRVVEWSVEGILAKHHNAKRAFDYKCIKRMLKLEQNMSITSVEDSEEPSVEDKKSHYSDMLQNLEEEELSDSNVLQLLCKQIDEAMPKQKKEPPPRFRGSFQSEKFFENYLLGEENRAKEKVKQEKRKVKAIAMRKEIENKQETQDKSSGIQALLRKIRGKQEKFVYNTNIRIEIRNAKFYSNGDPRKDTIFSKLNFLSGEEPSQKGISEVYKSSRRTEDRSKSREHRLRTGDSKDISRPKERVNYQVEKILYPFKEAVLVGSKQKINDKLVSNSKERLAYGQNGVSKEELVYGLHTASKEKLNNALRSNYPSKEKITMSRRSLLKEERGTISRLSGEKQGVTGITSRKKVREYQGLRNGAHCQSVKKLIAPDDRLASRKRSTTMTNLHSRSQKKIVGVYTRVLKEDSSLNKQQMPRSKMLSIKELLNRKLAFEKY